MHTTVYLQLGAEQRRRDDTGRKYWYMVAMRDGETTAVPLEEVAGKLKMVDPKCGLIKEAKTIGISFGDE